MLGIRVVLNGFGPRKGEYQAISSESTKGMDISGKTGQPVLASAAGKVVYSGTGLRGYGKTHYYKA